MQTPNAKQITKGEFTPSTLSIYPVFEMLGDSMANGHKSGIYNGNVVTGQPLDREMWSSPALLVHYLRMNPGKRYVIVTGVGAVIADIDLYRSDEGVLVCNYLNPDKVTYPGFEVRVDAIRELYRVSAVAKYEDIEDSESVES